MEAVVDRLLAASVDALELAHELPAVREARTQRSARRFDPPQRRADVVEVDVSALKHDAQHVCRVVRLGAVDAGSTLLAAARPDQPLGLENPQRLADRRLADVELGEQRLLGRQEVLISVRPPQDPGANGVGNQLGDQRAAKLRSRWGRVGVAHGLLPVRLGKSDYDTAFPRGIRSQRRHATSGLGLR